MLLNLSNHPSENWSSKQTKMASEAYGGIKDMAFPNISLEADETDIEKLSDEFLKEIMNIAPTAVHIMGEMTFSFCLIHKIKNEGISCLASTTERIVKEKDGVKSSVFKFIRFREY